MIRWLWRAWREYRRERLYRELKREIDQALQGRRYGCIQYRGKAPW